MLPEVLEDLLTLTENNTVQVQISSLRCLRDSCKIRKNIKHENDMDRWKVTGSLMCPRCGGTRIEIDVKFETRKEGPLN